MRIHLGHRKHAAAILIGSAGALGLGGTVSAEAVINPIAASTGSSGIDLARGAPATEIPVTDFNHGPASNSNSNSGAALASSVREMLLRDRQWLPSATARPDSALTRADRHALASSASTAVAAAASEEANWVQELNNAAKEAARPLFEELAESGLVAAVRDLDAELGLNKRWSFGDPRSRDDAQKTGPNAHPEAVSWQRPGEGVEPGNRSRSVTWSEADRVSARIRMEKYIEEIKSWLFSLVGLVALGYLAKLGLDYSRSKAVRRRRHGAKSVRRRRRKHRTRAAPDKLGA